MLKEALKGMLRRAPTRMSQVTTENAEVGALKNYMRWEDIGRCSEAWLVAGGAQGSPYDEFRGAWLPLPKWWNPGLDPWSNEYVTQMDRLWRDMVGVAEDYDPMIHEVTGDAHVDPIVRPGLYNDVAEQAGNHLIAMGHIVKFSEVRPGSRVIEYGAGFGQNSVTFARMGCEVHTVDIDATFCTAVTAQANFLGLNLTAHREEFGYNPGGQFDLILFYECFHHSRSWQTLISQMREMLVPGGKIILAGEPIFRSDFHEPFRDALPYPWGLRLEAETAAITRIRKWYELGFWEDFIVEAFARGGFQHRFRPGIISAYAEIHEFTLA